MAIRQLELKDPRTVARDVPGVIDQVFPQLTTGVALYMNRQSVAHKNITPISEKQISNSSMNRGILFEVAIVATDLCNDGESEIDWEKCLQIAKNRHSKYFSTKNVKSISEADKCIARHVHQNLSVMIKDLCPEESRNLIISQPIIPGCRWISSGFGDYAVGESLIEVKCTEKGFGMADYRQVMMYWLLSYAASIEGRGNEWKDCTLINPRRNKKFQSSFNDLIELGAIGVSKTDIYLQFMEVLSSYEWRTMNH